MVYMLSCGPPPPSSQDPPTIPCIASPPGSSIPSSLQVLPPGSRGPGISEQRYLWRSLAVLEKVGCG